MPAKWRVAKSLLQLRDQINALAPARSKASDGTIGDARHAASKSEHNPDAHGVVRAMDITNDPAHGVIARKLGEALIASRDPRILYVISNRQINSSVTAPWTWRPYHGVNAHEHHVHLSVVADPKLYDDVQPWAITAAQLAGEVTPTAVVTDPASPPVPAVQLDRGLIIDTAARATPARLAAWAEAGIGTVIRYLDRDGDAGARGKEITDAELADFVAAGMRLGLVYEGHGNQVAKFTRESGLADATYAQKRAAELGAPDGVVLWFAVDFDAIQAQLDSNVAPYFEGVNEAFTTTIEGVDFAYEIGVYGSGLVHDYVRDAGLADWFWLCQSRGWGGPGTFKRVLAERKWHLFQHMNTTIGGVQVDPDEANPDPGFDSKIGDFDPAAAASAADTGTDVGPESTG
jgi:hypothetical protein